MIASNFPINSILQSYKGIRQQIESTQDSLLRNSRELSIFRDGYDLYRQNSDLKNTVNGLFTSKDNVAQGISLITVARSGFSALRDISGQIRDVLENTQTGAIDSSTAQAQLAGLFAAHDGVIQDSYVDGKSLLAPQEYFISDLAPFVRYDVATNAFGTGRDLGGLIERDGTFYTVHVNRGYVAKSTDFSQWSNAGDFDIGDHSRGNGLFEFNDRIYATNYTTSGETKLYEYDIDNESLSLVTTLPDLLVEPPTFEVIGDNVYTQDQSGNVYAFDGVNATQLNLGGTQLANIGQFQNQLVGIDVAGNLYQYDGTSLNQIGSTAATSINSVRTAPSLVEFQDELYIYHTNNSLYTYDGEGVNDLGQPVDASNDPLIKARGQSLYHENGKLYLNGESTADTQGATLLSFDGVDWVTESNSTFSVASSIFVTNDNLYTIGNFQGYIRANQYNIGEEPRYRDPSYDLTIGNKQTYALQGYDLTAGNIGLDLLDASDVDTALSQLGAIEALYNEREQIILNQEQFLEVRDGLDTKLASLYEEFRVDKVDVDEEKKLAEIAALQLRESFVFSLLQSSLQTSAGILSILNINSSS